MLILVGPRTRGRRPDLGSTVISVPMYTRSRILARSLVFPRLQQTSRDGLDDDDPRHAEVDFIEEDLGRNPYVPSPWKLVCDALEKTLVLGVLPHSRGPIDPTWLELA